MVNFSERFEIQEGLQEYFDRPKSIDGGLLPIELLDKFFSKSRDFNLNAFKFFYKDFFNYIIDNHLDLITEFFKAKPYLYICSKQDLYSRIYSYPLNIEGQGDTQSSYKVFLDIFLQWAKENFVIYEYERAGERMLKILYKPRNIFFDLKNVKIGDTENVFRYQFINEVREFISEVRDLSLDILFSDNRQFNFNDAVLVNIFYLISRYYKFQDKFQDIREFIDNYKDICEYIDSGNLRFDCFLRNKEVRKICRKLGFFSQNPKEDYEKFITYKYTRLEDIFEVYIDDVVDRRIVICRLLGVSFSIGRYHRDPYLQFLELKNLIYKRIKSYLFDRYRKELNKKVENNEATEDEKELFSFLEEYSCERGMSSPYYYDDSSIYEIIKFLGIEKADELLSYYRDDRDWSRIINNFERLTYIFPKEKITNWPIARLRRELDIMDIVYKRNVDLNDDFIYSLYKDRIINRIEGLNGCKKLGKNAFGQDLLRIIGKSKAYSFYKILRKCYLFYNLNSDNLFNVQKLKYIFKSCKGKENCIYDIVENRDMLVFIDRVCRLYGGLYSESEDKVQSLINKVINSYFVHNKSFYVSLLSLFVNEDDKDLFEQVIKLLDKLGDNEFNIDFLYSNLAILQEIDQEEFELLVKEKLSIWEDILNAISIKKYIEFKKSKPDFINEKDIKTKENYVRILSILCMSNDLELEWFKNAYEYIGKPDFFVKFILKFFDRSRSVHDQFLWMQYIERLSTKELRSIISTIETIDQFNNFGYFLSKYSRELDPKKEIAIRSIDELVQRCYLIETNFDFSIVPDELFGIVHAPQFDLSALKNYLLNNDKFKKLIKGEYDETQPFRVEKLEVSDGNLSFLLKDALGSRKQGIIGKARSPGRLFKEVQALLRDYNSKYNTDLNIEYLLDKGVPLDLEQDIIYLLKKFEYPELYKHIFIAQVHAKSDPDSFVAGNYTDCCMKFGTGYCDDYMFNPCTQIFTVKNGVGRIIAQSVVVDAVDRETGDDVIILDNIEVADNYKNLLPQISRAYQIFWTKYSNKKVLVGTGYLDLIPPGGILVKNTFRPKSRLGYSDAAGPNVYIFPKLENMKEQKQELIFSNLTEREIKLIVELEQGIYPDSMVLGEDFIRKILNKQRNIMNELGLEFVPGSLSSFYIRFQDKPIGYCLVLPEKSCVEGKEDYVLHIYDMAILPEFQGKGFAKQMLSRILDIIRSYSDLGLKSIEFEARESTSWTFLNNPRMQEWLKSKGFEITYTKKLDKFLGQEDFYFVRLEYKEN